MLSSPLDVCLGLTSKCNLSCQHCINRNASPDLDLTTPELLKVIDQLGQAKVFNISLFGGEPLLQPDFFRIVERLGRYPIKVSLNTNAGLIDKPIAKKLFECRIKTFCVSFDGSKPEVMDKMRGQGAFAGCLKGIENLRKYPVGIVLSCTLTRYNIHDIKGMVVLAKSLGVNSMRFNHIFYGGNAACFKDKVMVSPKEELVAITELTNLQREFGSFITGSYLQQKDKFKKLKSFNPSKDKVTVPPCGAAMQRCNIRPDGKVTPCEVIWEVVAGDLRKQSFLEIWRNSPIMNEFRRAHTVDLKDRPGCQECRCQYLCFVGHRCSPYYYPDGLEDKSLYCWKEAGLEKICT